MLKVALYVFCCCSFAEVQGDETTFYHLPYLQAPLRSSCKVILPYLIKFFAFHVFCLLSPKILRICSPSFTALFLRKAFAEFTLRCHWRPFLGHDEQFCSKRLNVFGSKRKNKSFKHYTSRPPFYHALRAYNKERLRLQFCYWDLIGQCYGDVTIADQSVFSYERGKSKVAPNLFLSPCCWERDSVDS